MVALLFSAFLWSLLAALLGVFGYVLAITVRMLLRRPGREKTP